MTKRTLWLPKFDPTARYAAARPMTINGVALQPGDPLPADLSPRRVRQLYEYRHAVPLAPATVPAAEEPPADAKKRGPGRPRKE